MVYNSAIDLVGGTPLVRLSKIKEKYALVANVLGKLEYLNPQGSITDRVAKNMIIAAEKEGKIHRGGTIIEATSGNTGIGLAFCATLMGYNAIIVMPDNVSAERVNIIKALGGNVVLTSGKLGMSGAIAKAEEIQKNTPNSIIAGQFESPHNPETHCLTTGPEIYDDTNGNVDILVCGVGTGGTISGIGNYLRSKKPEIEIIAVEPASSPYLSEGKGGAHGIQGIGAGFIPKTLDTTVYNEIIRVQDEDAIEYARSLGTSEGILCGISSGAALCAAIEVAKREENKDKNIVVILPDSADRYYSTALFK